uniref:Uncharacterized protein n=1 Tax=Chromera velia CCMP2878 TaxID=1169474 RepID=A0A0G4HWT2_9ALVE|eukprot:Cvel_9102.t1-p1 / transcript=Cvel_9102.t1 / gene=Cvel_9102 / organism=Chromera_velia_CCMP2878 / gene_product=hypothetical protein / transcript_product=hypothetical protein / location=Cvel_scaffold517:8361-9089(-) / protein_length=114 / sequence_SO=supercontig / SO=protein_coding / is_pseudo=false
MRRSLIVPSSCPICPPTPGTTLATNFDLCCRDLEQAAYASSATPALHLSAMKNQSLPFWADAEVAEEDDAVRCELLRGGAGGRAEGWYEWREEGEEEEDEEEDEDEEAWREEEE